MVARGKLLAERKIGGSKEKIGELSRRARVKTKKRNWAQTTKCKHHDVSPLG